MEYSEKVQKGQRALLFIQTFSMLGFSILYSTLILYLTQGLKLTSAYSVAMTGSFIALNFVLQVLGGFVGGRFLSYRGLFATSMLLQAVGALILAAGGMDTLVLGVSIFLAGCGLSLICINCLLTQLFDPHDKKRETAFLWNYSGMNFGFLIGFLISGFFQLQQLYGPLFVFASIGSLVSFGIILANWSLMRDKNTSYRRSRKKNKRSFVGFAIVVATIAVLSFLLKHALISNDLIALVGIFVILCFIYFSWKEPSKKKANKLRAFVILAIGGTVFWTLYQMTPMGLTLFYERNVNHYVFGFPIPPQWLPLINSLIIIIGGPLMATINHSLRKKGVRVSIPFQFTLSLLLMGLGLLLVHIGIGFADPKGISSIYWVIGYFVCQSIGELFISPIGYAMVGQLIPQKIQGFGMGTWLMVTGIGAAISSYFSQAALGSIGDETPLATNPKYSIVFLQLAIIGIGFGILFFFLRPFLHKLIQEKHSPESEEPAPFHGTHK